MRSKQRKSKRLIFVLNFICVLLVAVPLSGKVFRLSSPDNRIEVRIDVADKITYAVSCNNIDILAPSPISMTLGNKLTLGANPQITNTKTRTVNEKIHPVVPVKRKVIIDHYNEIAIDFAGNFGLVFRAYDDGIAYRFVTGFDKRIKVYSEQVVFNFTKDHKIYFPEETNFITGSERSYEYLSISKISPKRFCSLPALVDINNGPKVLITEVDLSDYAGLYLRGGNTSSLYGLFPAVILKKTMRKTHKTVVQQRADYIAETDGSRSFPWRAMIITEKDGDLINSEMVFKLAGPLQLKDTSWIKPGKVAWDWYNANNVYGVDFRAGVNTDTYKYYIDFAAKYGIEYVILDEGWSKLDDLLTTTAKMDLPEIFRYAKSKNVGVILWVTWKALNDQLVPAMEQFEKWGAVGIKVDFMERDDQWMVNYYEKIAREAAKYHLLVDFHGSYKPSGLRRAYPNVITREGVKGQEHNKWSDNVSPEHDVIIPFIRMAAGPMDYTPGGMLNAQKKNFRPIFDRPMSQGTRCHQLAMYVVFESPLQMLTDSPSHYLREPECMEFLSAVPSVWDETLVLNAKVGDYVLIARQSGSDWYVGAMTDWNRRELNIDFSFLPRGEYTIHIYQDGINADRYASDYKKRVEKISSTDKMKIKLAPGGGWAARITTGIMTN
jgi:alpha-glucosidase